MCRGELLNHCRICHFCPTLISWKNSASPRLFTVETDMIKFSFSKFWMELMTLILTTWCSMLTYLHVDILKRLFYRDVERQSDKTRFLWEQLQDGVNCQNLSSTVILSINSKEDMTNTFKMKCMTLVSRVVKYSDKLDPDNRIRDPNTIRILFWSSISTLKVEFFYMMKSVIH